MFDSHKRDAVWQTHSVTGLRRGVVTTSLWLVCDELFRQEVLSRERRVLTIMMCRLPVEMRLLGWNTPMQTMRP